MHHQIDIESELTISLKKNGKEIEKEVISDEQQHDIAAST